MNRDAFAVAWRMTESVRWYDWVGRTSLGEVVRCQSLTMMKEPYTRNVLCVNVQPHKKETP